MREPRKLAQHIQIRQLSQLVGRQHQVCQVRDRVGQRRLDRGDAIARQEEGVYPRRQGEVAEGLDVIVGEVYRVLWLFWGLEGISASQSE